MSTLSMTAFGQACAENGVCRVTVSIRSVNHRFLDLVIRLPDSLRELEQDLRQQMSVALQRGRVEVRVQADRLVPAPAEIEVHSEAIEALAELARDLGARGLTEGALRPGDLLALPDVLRVSSADAVWGEEETDLLHEALAGALAQQLEGRAAEGRRLEEILDARLDELVALVATLEGRRKEVRDRLYDSLRGRLSELLADREIGADRLAQEAAILADRSDIQEELDRLGAHVGHFREVLTHEGPSGRRLDFLTQEILRELNTVGSKSRDAEMAAVVVEAKVVCEQLREQVQNVE